MRRCPQRGTRVAAQLAKLVRSHPRGVDESDEWAPAEGSVRADQADLGDALHVRDGTPVEIPCIVRRPIDRVRDHP